LLAYIREFWSDTKCLGEIGMLISLFFQVFTNSVAKQSVVGMMSYKLIFGNDLSKMSE